MISFNKLIITWPDMRITFINFAPTYIILEITNQAECIYIYFIEETTINIKV